MRYNRREFFICVIPSVLAFALSGIYAIVDGFFVGNSIGDVGLSAINIAYPVTALLQAAGTGIGMGGAVQYAIRAAQGKQKEQNAYFSAALVLLLVCSISITGVTFLVRRPVLILLGAQGEIFELGEGYLFVITLGTVFQIFGTGVVPLIRNMGGSLYAMGIMAAGFAVNILLDYLFVWVFPLGIKGAAAATVIGQAVTAAGGLLYFIRRRLTFALPDISRRKTAYMTILKIAVSPFGITFSPMVTLMLMNRFAMWTGGTQTVACYACVAYVTTIVYMLLQGVGDGSQPLISQHYGCRDREKLRHTEYMAYMTAAIVAVASAGVLYFAREMVGYLFGASSAVNQEVAEALPFFLVGFLFLSYTRVTTSVFYASEKSIQSYILVYAEPVFLFVFLLFLPDRMGISGLWGSVLGAQIVTAILAKLQNSSFVKGNVL